MESQAGDGEEGQQGRLLWLAQTVKFHAVQCAKCGKFRLIPSKKKYEKIREKILEQPWVCEDAFEWDSDAKCELPDLLVGNSKLVLTVDKPGIPATPVGWDRSVHIRAGPGNEHFSDIFYFAPGNGTRSSRRLRSIKGIERYVEKFPDSRPPAADMRRVFSFARPASPCGVARKVLGLPGANVRRAFSFARPLHPRAMAIRIWGRHVVGQEP